MEALLGMRPSATWLGIFKARPFFAQGIRMRIGMRSFMRFKKLYLRLEEVSRGDELFSNLTISLVLYIFLDYPRL